MSERDPLADLLRRWTSEHHAEAARVAREQARWQRQLAQEETRFSGVLLDLFERTVPVTLHTEQGRSHSGQLVLVGQDFCAIQPDERPALVVAIGSISGVQIEASVRAVGPASGRQMPDEAQWLGALLDELTHDRAPIRFLLKNAATVRSGELFSVGQDVVTIATSVPANQTLYVPISHFSEVTVGNM